VHKTKAVVRFMFHTPEDVRWFRPVEVWTKAGRRGRIREPVSLCLLPLRVGWGH
jgi:pre-rRNA-processing protein TSR1